MGHGNPAIDCTFPSIAMTSPKLASSFPELAEVEVLSVFFLSFQLGSAVTVLLSYQSRYSISISDISFTRIKESDNINSTFVVAIIELTHYFSALPNIRLTICLALYLLLILACPRIGMCLHYSTMVTALLLRRIISPAVLAFDSTPIPIARGHGRNTTALQSTHPNLLLMWCHSIHIRLEICTKTMSQRPCQPRLVGLTLGVIVMVICINPS